MKLKWQDPKHKDIVLKIKESLNKPEVKEKKAMTFKHTIETTDFCEKMSMIAKEVSNRHEVKDAKSKFHKDFQNRPEISDAKKKFMKEYQNRPEIKERTSNFQKEYQNRSDIKQKQSEMQKKVWSNAAYKQNMSEIQKEAQNRPAVKEANSNRMKTYCSLPGIKEKMSMYQKIAQNKPETKQKKSETLINLWNDPEWVLQHCQKHGIYYDYELPSGKIVKLQGYEPQVLTELLKTYSEDDIVIGVKEINKEIGQIKYMFEEKEHTYYPDFYIKSENKIIEVKSQWTFDRWKEKNLAKQNTCLELGFDFDFKILEK